MQTLNTAFKTLAVLLGTFYLTSCQKNISFTEAGTAPVQAQESQANKNTDRQEFKKIRIKKTVQYGLSPFSSFVRTGIFEYNKWGDPERLLFDYNSSDENETNWLFKYNQKRQLTDAIKSYTGAYLLWFKYVYDNKGVVTRDTTQNFGRLEGETPLPGYQKWVNYYSYDSQNRISKIHSVSGSGSTQDFIYNYDSNGNLIRQLYDLQGQPLAYTYDNQANPQRTHEVFMFVARDYSRNNIISAERYNDWGLPLTFRQQGRLASFLGMNITNADIEYEKD